MGSKLKEQLFAWYWLAPVIIFLALIFSLSMGWLGENNERIWITLITASLAWTYFFQKQKLEEDKLFIDVFESYNKRFYELSDELNNLPDDTDCSKQIAPVVHKYFDLCIEQYQLYERGRIPENVWIYWVSGMNYLIEARPPIKQYWKEMEKQGLSIELTREYIKSRATKDK